MRSSNSASTPSDAVRQHVLENSQRLKESGLTELELARRRRGDPVEVSITLRPRQETTMTLSLIAERLRMGIKTHLPHLLYWQGAQRKKSGE
ncbi:MAG: hypothetical protein ABSF95_03710 [Verrucomicrobiota bacterium]